jgi:hypothetical protein
MVIEYSLEDKELNEILSKNIRNVFDTLLSTQEKHGINLNVYMRTDYDSPFIPTILESVNEGLIRTYPIDTTIRYISDFFNIEEGIDIWSRKDKNGVDKIYVKAPNYKEVFDALIHAFRLCGYHFENTVSKSYGLNDGVGFVTHCFAPMHMDDISVQLRNECRFLYHATPRYNAEKIRNIGFSPRAKNRVFNFPERIYFIKDTITEEQLLGLAYQLAYYNGSDGNNGEYTLFKVDLAKIPNTVPFFLDPSYGYGVYTTSNIRPNCIVDIAEIDFNERKPQIKWKGQ